MKSYFLRRAVSRGARRTVSFSKKKSTASFSRSKSGLNLGKKPSISGRRRLAKRFTWNCVNVPPGACKCFTAVMTLLLFTGAIVMVVLYFHKQKRPAAERNKAMIAIREFMILQNESFKGKSDLEILDGAQKLAWDLNELQSRNDEIERASEDIFTKLRGRWKSFSGNLYLFVVLWPLNFQDAKNKCIQFGSNLVDITSRKEEEYLESEVSRGDGMFYIGLEKDGDTWKWVTGEPLTTGYWGAPIEGHFVGSCAVMTRLQQEGQRWQKIDCKEYKKYICKVKPNPKFL